MVPVFDLPDATFCAAAVAGLGAPLERWIVLTLALLVRLIGDSSVRSGRVG